MDTTFMTPTMNIISVHQTWTISDLIYFENLQICDFVFLTPFLLNFDPLSTYMTPDLTPYSPNMGYLHNLS